MYTARKTPLGRLRVYHRELGDRYEAALDSHQFEKARQVRCLRWRVWRAIRIREEWGDAWGTEAVPEFLRHAA